MASVSTKNSAQWHAALNIWHAEAGHPAGGVWKRTWRATGVPATEPKKTALVVAAALQSAARKAGPANPLRMDPRTFASALEGIWESAGLTPPRAAASWNDFQAEYLDACQLSADMRPVYRNFLTSFARHIGPAKAGGIMQGISHEDCQSFYDYLITTGLSEKTVRNYLKCVRACFDRAQKRRIIPQNPAALVKTPLGSGGQRQPFSLEEVAAILRLLEAPPREAVHCRGFLHGMVEEWRTAILLGLWCGMRLGDATRRVWSDFDEKLTRVTFVPEKKSRRGIAVTLPVVGALRAHLLTLPRPAAGPAASPASVPVTVLLTPRLAPSDKNSVRFGKLLALAGIESLTPLRKSARAKPKRPKSFHSLRHTILTEMARAGVDKQLRQLFADHDDPAVNDRYTHAIVERLADALASTMPTAAEPPPRSALGDGEQPTSQPE